MKNVGDYAFTSQDPFSRRPITAGDGLVFSSIAYSELDTYGVPFPAPIIDFAGVPGCRPILLSCAASDRFSEVKIVAQKTIFSTEERCQFSGTACTFENVLFISFRGTDETVVGWLEDFDLISRLTIPCQRHALEFLNEIGEKFEGDIYLSGHSKGGNCAVFAAAFCRPEIKKRIKTVFSFDGPGFLPEIRDTAEYKEILPRVKKFVPKMSFFGMFLLGDDPVIPCKCHGFWFLQHDHYSWYINDDGKMADGKNLSRIAKKTKFVFHRIISCLSKEERKIFGKIAEDSLLYAGVTSMYNMSVQSVFKLLKYLLTLKDRRERKFGRWLVRETILGVLTPMK